jgi:hypothetical protein
MPPEVEQHHLPQVVAQPKGLAVDVLCVDVWRLVWFGRRRTRTRCAGPHTQSEWPRCQTPRNTGNKSAYRHQAYHLHQPERGGALPGSHAGSSH